MKSNAYYILKYSTDNKIVGNTYPQIQQMIDGYNYSSENSLWNVEPTKIPDFTPNLNGFKLKSKAKLTDFLSVSVINYGFLISNQAKSILSNFELPIENKFYNAVVYNGKANYGFNLFHFSCDLTKFIDFKRTEFYLENYLERKNIDKTIYISDFKILIDKYFPEYEIKTDKIIFENNFENKFDIFKITTLDTYPYISHRLKTALEEAHITGIEIVPTDVI